MCGHVYSLSSVPKEGREGIGTGTGETDGCEPPRVSQVLCKSSMCSLPLSISPAPEPGFHSYPPVRMLGKPKSRGLGQSVEVCPRPRPCTATFLGALLVALALHMDNFLGLSLLHPPGHPVSYAHLCHSTPGKESLSSGTWQSTLPHHEPPLLGPRWSVYTCMHASPYPDTGCIRISRAT